jgi:hypothetical protein
VVLGWWERRKREMHLLRSKVNPRDRHRMFPREQFAQRKGTHYSCVYFVLFCNECFRRMYDLGLRNNLMDTPSRSRAGSRPWFDHALLPIPVRSRDIGQGTKPCQVSMTSLRWSEGPAPCPVRWLTPCNSGFSASKCQGVTPGIWISNASRKAARALWARTSWLCYTFDCASSRALLCSAGDAQHAWAFFSPEENQFLHEPRCGALRHRLPSRRRPGGGAKTLGRGW